MGSLYGRDYSVLRRMDYSILEARAISRLSAQAKIHIHVPFREDRHTKTASEIFGIAQSLVTPEQRSYGKRINFQRMYGEPLTCEKHFIIEQESPLKTLKPKKPRDLSLSTWLRKKAENSR